MIRCRTNLDKYDSNVFPQNLEFVPQLNTKVRINSNYIEYFRTLKLPIELTVVDVIHTDNDIIVELHYSDIQIKMAKLNNNNLF